MKEKLRKYQSRHIETIVNDIFALNCLFWAVFGLILDIQENSLSIVRICTSILHVVACILLFFRIVSILQFNKNDTIVFVFSVLLTGFLFKTSQPFYSWPLIYNISFIMGTLISCTALLNLGKSFAILPSKKEVVQSGLYRIIRHPAYFGEIILTLTCFFINPVLYRTVPLILCILCFFYRINVEEQILSQDNQYQKYMKRVRWKIFPKIW